VHHLIFPSPAFPVPVGAPIDWEADGSSADPCLQPQRADPIDGPPFHAVVATQTNGPVPYLPLLLIETPSGEVSVSLQAAAYVRASASTRNQPSLTRDLKTFGRLYDFARITVPGGLSEPGDLYYLVCLYLLHRSRGTIAADLQSTLGGLRWHALNPAGLAEERKAIGRLVRFQAISSGSFSLSSQKIPLNDGGTTVKRLASLGGLSTRDFFSHLSAARAYWQARYGDEQPFSDIAPARSRKRKQPLTVVPLHEILAIIDAEENPVFRALWIQAAFGGLRISEQLNQWKVDVLPPSARPSLFGFADEDTILSVRADPRASRYVGDIGRPGLSRGQFLHLNNLGIPRPDYPIGHPFRAGWKGTDFCNDELLIHPVYWIDASAADQFAECAAEIRAFHLRNHNCQCHPFFFVNIGTSAEDHLGQPIRISNVQKAWNRACRRCGLPPHRWGRRIHGLRHFYKFHAQHELGLSAESIQIMLGHSTVDAQDDYGRSAREANAALAAARATHGNLSPSASR
jgi:integrase